MINFKHPSYTENIAKWQLIKNICDGKNLKNYLVKINPDDASVSAVQRRDQFFKRSVFYAIAGYTTQGFLGKAFSDPAKCEVPAELDYVKYDIDGAGTSIYQQCQEVFKEVVQIGRAGLLVDFPQVEGEVSREAQVRGQISATVTKYSAEQIVNWQVKKIGAKVKPVLIVLKTVDHVRHDDGFGFDEVDVYIELRLEEGSYVQREWRKIEETDEWYLYSEAWPRDASGNYFDFIPFVFVGSEANTSQIDFAPMHDIAQINIGHYNNSAIYEDSVFTVGQVQPWMSGLSQDVIDDLNKSGIFIGSGRLMGVPSGEKFDFAQAQPNSLAREAMIDKVDMMVGLGAMFLTKGGVAKTATQVDGELMAQHSVLSLISANVSEAYNQALGIVKLFMGASQDDEAYLELNQEFVKPNATAQDINAMVASFLQGALPLSDLFQWQRRHGLVDSDKTLEEYQEDIGMHETIELDE